MPDKFEREIEEILAKLDDDLPAEKSDTQGGSPRSPVSLDKKRQQRAKAERVRTARPSPFQNFNPTTLLFAGAAIMFGGLILSGFWGPAIWASLAGVLLFIGAFFWSFRKAARPGGTPSRQGHYWRDRWIDDSPSGGTSNGVKGWFRRK